MADLTGQICLVTGASRGVGRGVALQLVTHGATCYITGRSLQSLRLVEDEVKSRGLIGKLILIECDHSCDKSVENLFKQIADEQNGQLDLLVNNAFAGVQFIADNNSLYFWDQDAADSWDKLNNVGLRSNYICAVYAARLMVPCRKGLIINISSSGGKSYLFLPQYGVGKAGTDRMAKDCANELSKYNVAFLSLWPGLVKTEKIGAAITQKQIFSASDKVLETYYSEAESPEFCGKAVVNLLNDRSIMNRSGQIELTTDLGSEFNFKDVDGSTPVGQRSIRLLLLIVAPWLGSLIPNWLKIPKFIYFWLLGFVKSPVPNKLVSKYE